MIIYITNRGENWEQLKWQINFSDSDHEESTDTLELAIEEARAYSPNEIHIKL